MRHKLSITGDMTHWIERCTCGARWECFLNRNKIQRSPLNRKAQTCIYKNRDVEKQLNWENTN